MTIAALLPYRRWELSFHVISVMGWMAGMICLPVLYAYHGEAAPGSAEAARFAGAERALFKRLVNPAMNLAFLSGILLILTPGTISWSARWWWVKLICIFLLSAFHGELSRWRRALRDGSSRRPARFYGFATAIPVALAITIVIMVIVQP